MLPFQPSVWTARIKTVGFIDLKYVGLRINGRALSRKGLYAPVNKPEDTPR
jgi:hypothetical protein